MAATGNPVSSSVEGPFHLIQGVQAPQFVLQEEVDKLKDLQLYPDDVWVVSYPKSGTTWVQQIIRLIRSSGVQDDVKIDFAVPWLEAVARPRIREANFSVEQVQRPRAFKSHFPYDSLPCGPPHTTPCKYVYVIRNPKDVAVSAFFHSRLRFFPDIDWDSFWKKFIDGDMEFGNYFDHLLSWLAHKAEANMIILQYEDMKKDLKRAVSKIAAFIDVHLSDEVVCKIADLTCFEKMKMDDTANYSWNKRHHKEKATAFMRKGIVGDWKNFLTAEQSAQMDALCAERLKDTGLVFEYE